MTRSVEEIEREVEASRAGLDDTIEALKSKMSPGQLLDELAQSFKGSGGGDLIGTLGAQVKDNPLAVAMIGAGVAWLMASKASGGAATASHPSGVTSDGFMRSEGASSSSSGLSDVKDEATTLAHDAASRAGDAAAQLKDGALGVAGHAKHGVEALGHGAAGLGHKVQRSFMDTLDHEPLVIGALGLAVGVAIGTALPSTRLEDRSFGAAKDSLLAKTKARAAEELDHVKDAATAAYQGVSDAAQEQGLVGSGAPGGSIVEKAETVLRAGVDAAKSSFGDTHGRGQDQTA